MDNPGSTAPAVDISVGRVLVADDEEKNRRMLRDILEGQGHQVTLAVDGPQAMEKALVDPPDVVLLDVMMPGMDGYEVCRQLRRASRTAHLPVLMVTALKDRTDRLKGIQAGANDFLTKPIDAEEIRLRVKNAVLVKHLYDKVRDDYVRLKELETLRDNLTHMIVHDMRSPLMVLSCGYEIILREKERLSREQEQYIAMGQSACRNLIEMVSSVLDVSRMEAGLMPLTRVSCDVLELARAAALSMTTLGNEKKLTIRVSGNPGIVVADRDIIQRVLVNLLGNAIKFSPNGGTIGIEVSSIGEKVHAVVTDQGLGIPPEYHQRIFEKFGQVESRKEGRIYSTGLGLTFCKLAVEAHGGEIGVKSLVGVGSAFWFTLPGSRTN